MRGGSYLLPVLFGLALGVPSTAAPVDDLEALGLSGEVSARLVSRWEADAGGPPADSLVAVIGRAVQRQAPLALVVDKAEEGLAKGVPTARLLPALDRWGMDLSRASELATRLHRRFDPGDVDRRDTVLRIHLLRTSDGADRWLRPFFRDAVEIGPGLEEFLGAGEAVSRLRASGLSDDEARGVGRRWLADGVPAAQMEGLVLAIEAAGRDMPLADAARRVSDRAADGWTADEVLARLERGAGLPADADPAGAPEHVDARPDDATAPGLDGRDLPAARSVEEIPDDGDAGQDVPEEDLDDGRDGASGGERGPDTDVDGGDRAPDDRDAAREDVLDDGRGDEGRDNQENDR